MIKYLRIAVTALSLTACVLLIALWVHTIPNQVRMEFWVAKSQFLRFTTYLHWTQIEISSYQTDPPLVWYPNSTFQDNYVANPTPKTSPVHRWQLKTYSIGPGMSATSLTTPFWFPVLLTVIVAILPWANSLSKVRRFSLRTLLIATTLVAVGLGVVIYLAR